MTYLELLQKAEILLNRNDITLGEYEKMIKPLDREINEEAVPVEFMRSQVDREKWEEIITRWKEHERLN